MSFLKSFVFFISKKKVLVISNNINFINFGGLIVLTQGTVVAPFIYTIFNT